MNKRIGLFLICIVFSLSCGWMAYGAKEDHTNIVDKKQPENTAAYDEIKVEQFGQVLEKSTDAIQQVAERKRKDAEKIKEEAERIGAAVEKAAKVSGESITPDYIRSNLTENMSKDEVAALLGDHYKKLKNEEGDVTKWRYDFIKNSAYEISADSQLPDVEGLRAGHIRAQLFLEWSKGEAEGHHEAGKLSTYTFYQLEEDGEIWEYGLSEDGEELTQVYKPSNR